MVTTAHSKFGRCAAALFAGSLLALPAVLADAAQLNGIRFANNINRTQVILDLTNHPQYQLFPLTGPDRLVVDLTGTQLQSDFLLESLASSSLVNDVRYAPRGENGLRIVLDLNGPVSSRTLALDPAGQYGHRLLIELVGQQNLAINTQQVQKQYVVSKGDTLFSIARKHGVTVDELRTANNKSNNALEIGDQLQIPGQTRPAVAATGETTEPVKLSDGGWQHQVARGETLFSISQRYGVDLASLRSANQMAGNDIRVGDILLVPSTPLSDPANDDLQRHQVTSGDTLYSLSKRYNVPIRAIQQANNIRSNLLELGSQLVIPDPSKLEPEPEQPVYAYGSTTRHNVVQGENLFQIARRYRISIVRLRKANGLNGDRIAIGDELIIPPRVTATAQTDVYR